MEGFLNASCLVGIEGIVCVSKETKEWNDTQLSAKRSPDCAAEPNYLAFSRLR